MARTGLSRYVTDKGVDPWVVGIALLASLVGVLAVFDASFANALSSGSSQFAKPGMQLFGVGAAIVAYWVATKLGVPWLKRLAPWIALLMIVFVAFVPFYGAEVGGARRRLGPVQPAELLKPTMILLCAWLATVALPTWKRKCRDLVEKLDHRVLPILARLGFFLYIAAAFVLVEIQPDLGTAMVVGGIPLGMLFMGLGGKLFGKRYIWVALSVILAGFLVMGILAFTKGYRFDRIASFWDRWDPVHVDASGHQSAMAEKYLALGGAAGAGPLRGMAKQRLPAADTDFIYVTIGEEFGLIGSFLVITGLAVLSFRLIFLGSLCTSLFAKLIISGTGWWVGLQSVFNLMVAGVFMPAVGIPLPFISYGSSSLLALGIALGMCQAALRAEIAAVRNKHAPSVDRGRYRRARLSSG